MFIRINKLAHHLTSIRWTKTFSIAASSSPAWTDKPAAQKPTRSSDFSHVMDVESNLFENSRNGKPVDSKELLSRYTSKSNAKSRGSGPKASGGGNKFKSSSTNKESTASTFSTHAEPKPKPAKVKSEVVNSTVLGLTYTKLHLNDPWLNTLLVSVKSRKSRALKHQLLVEGRRLIIEAIESGLVLDYVLFSDSDQMELLKKTLPADAKLVKVPQGDLRVWSNLSTCPGLMAIFTKPHDMTDIWSNRKSVPLPITVICDQIREPNNVGSIIRNCAAIAVQQVIVTKGCADPWESKALRGGAGGQFKIPIRGPCEWSSIRSMLPQEDCFVYLAENSQSNAAKHIPADRDTNVIVPYNEVQYGGKHCVLVIGGETEGISADAYKLLSRNVLGKCVHIPLAEEVESLNTASALAVILFEMKKQILGNKK